MATQADQPVRRRLYLVQHGEARRQDIDPERSLTGAGRVSSRKTALWAAKAGISVDWIWHSGKKRAEETAAIIAACLKPSPPIRAVSGLDPDDDVLPIVGRLAELQETVLIVGHLPHLGRLANMLVLGGKGRELIAFYNCGLIGLVRAESGWLIELVLPPHLIG